MTHAQAVAAARRTLQRGTAQRVQIWARRQFCWCDAWIARSLDPDSQHVVQEDGQVWEYFIRYSD